MKLDHLMPVIVQVGHQLGEASQRFGRRIAVDPVAALARDVPLAPPGRWSPNRQCRMIAARDGWLAVNLARAEDRESVPAWLGCAQSAESWQAVAREARLLGCADLIARASLLGLPIAQVGEAGPPSAFVPGDVALTRRSARPRVIDMSALWAGPYCGALLAEAGLEVTRIESLTRPDPTPASTPGLDARLNGGKRRVTLDVRHTAQLLEMIAEVDILITSARPHALDRLGLDRGVLETCNPGLIHVAITAHGWNGSAGLRVGFGDDCAAAGGLIDWKNGAPHFIGDALADPLTGMIAALAVLEALEKGKCGLIDAGLAPVAAWFTRAVSELS